MRACEIRSLAVGRHRTGGLGAGPVLRVAGPGRFVTAELGCSYLGVDRDASAIDLARDRARAAGLSCRFEVGEVPPVPSGPYDVVLLLETLLAFADKDMLLREVSAALCPADGSPSPWRRDSPSPRRSGGDARRRHGLADPADRAGRPAVQRRARGPLEPRLQPLAPAGRRCPLDAFLAERSAIEAELGAGALDDLLAAHRLWRDWLATGGSASSRSSPSGPRVLMRKVNAAGVAPFKQVRPSLDRSL